MARRPRPRDRGGPAAGTWPGPSIRPCWRACGPPTTLGNPPRLLTDTEGGSPLRCCLRASAPGERVALVSYAPLRRWARSTGADPGPYDEVGPVFIHPAPCPGPAGDGLPAALLGAPRVFRAYSARGHILGGWPFGLDGTDPASVAGTSPASADGAGVGGAGVGGTGAGGTGAGGARVRGTGPAGAAEALLADIYADPAVAVVHVRAMAFGCFLFEALRGAPAPLPGR